MEDELANIFKTKVSVLPIKNKVGKIEIEYYDSIGLENIYEKLKR